MDKKEILSKREIAILELLAIGAQNKKIAEKLCITENTVEFHLKNIYVKLGVKNRIGATLAFIEHKF